MTVSDAVAPATGPDGTRTLAVSATYLLSEEGRKTSLLTGGNGHAVQDLTIDVPASRLHLVSVDASGVARLKLRPRYQLDGAQRVVRVDVAPTYDAPPDLDELFREAARNHQLEGTFSADRVALRRQRRDTELERRAHIAQAFLKDRNQRAIGHPAPTAKRCYLTTAHGRVLFDADRDAPPARQVPEEAHRRFRSDLREAKERNMRTRAEQLAVHEEKKRFIADWITAHGTPEQQSRHAAGVLPLGEAIEAITDHVFAPLGDRPRYTRDGATRLQTHFRQLPEYANIMITADNLRVMTRIATEATAGQWASVRDIQQQLCDSSVVLREHKLASMRDPRAPVLTIFGVLVTCKMGPLVLRREFEAS